MSAKETTPSVEPLFPDGTPCEVLDPDGKRVFGGFYVHHRKVVVCFAEDEKPENYAHAVFHSSMTDWGFPETWTLTEITPPHTIEAATEARVCHDRAKVYGRFECSSCGCVVENEELIDNGYLRFCPDCGRWVER